MKNGRAAGADGITAELLKGAEKPISEALHKSSPMCGPREEFHCMERRHYRLTLQGQRVAV